MRLPEELQSAIDHIVEKTSTTALRKARIELTEDYREGRSSHFNDEAKRLAYLGARFPATYGAIHKVLQNCPPFEHLLDLGAGPGTASWAAADLFPDLKKITLIEKSGEAIALGKSLAEFSSHHALQNGEWIQQSLSAPIPPGEAAILSYVLNELSDPKALIEQVWPLVSLLIVIEPGTPKGAQTIRNIRQQLIDKQAHILAPCPHSLTCPSDWCHFAARVERSRLHRHLKEGSLGYEDEKFSYLVASKTSGPVFGSRIIRHPQKQSGYVRLTLCSDSGKLEEKSITRKDKANYRKARDAEWGSVF